MADWYRTQNKLRLNSWDMLSYPQLVHGVDVYRPPNEFGVNSVGITTSVSYGVSYPATATSLTDGLVTGEKKQSVLAAESPTGSTRMADTETIEQLFRLAERSSQLVENSQSHAQRAIDMTERLLNDVKQLTAECARLQAGLAPKGCVIDDQGRCIKVKGELPLMADGVLLGKGKHKLFFFRWEPNQRYYTTPSVWSSVVTVEVYPNSCADEDAATALAELEFQRKGPATWTDRD